METTFAKICTTAINAEMIRKNVEDIQQQAVNLNRVGYRRSSEAREDRRPGMRKVVITIGEFKEKILKEVLLSSNTSVLSAEKEDMSNEIVQGRAKKTPTTGVDSIAMTHIRAEGIE